MKFDIVIRNGDVIDGTGLSRFRADVGVSDGRVVAIGRIGGKGEQEIDADGKVVTPGFVDGHTHLDAQFNWDPLGTSSCFHGVTTAVMGNCGFTLAPVRRGEHALVVRNLERAEDISAKAMELGIRWGWQTFPEYLDALDGLPKGMNCAVYLGHSALRTWAMGERAFEDKADEADLGRMEQQLEEGLAAGAIGFSTSRSANHATSDDRRIASRVADWSEVQRLVGVMSRRGEGIFEIALGPEMRNPDPAIRQRAFAMLQDLAVDSRVPMTFGLTIGASAGPKLWRDDLRMLESTAAAGGRAFAQSHSRDLSNLLSFRTELPFDSLPEWKEIRSLPLEEQARRLRDPAIRQVLVSAAHHGDYRKGIGLEARAPEWDMVRLYDKPLPPYPTIAEIAKERGKDAVEVMIDLGLESNFDCFFMQNFQPQDFDGLLEIMRHPQAIMTFSDSGAHVSQIADQSIQTHLLAYWVREREAFTLEQAVQMLTLAPARAWGFTDRGQLRVGAAADINVFDPARVGPRMPKVVRDLPGGARRLLQHSEGIDATIVNGAIVLRDGVPTGTLPGRLIRRFGVEAERFN